jgi:hypothetical protein
VAPSRPVRKFSLWGTGRFACGRTVPRESAEIEEHLEQMNPYDFQDLVAGLLRALGYHVAWVSPPGLSGWRGELQDAGSRLRGTV